MRVQTLKFSFMTNYTPGSACIMLQEDYEKYKDLLVVRYRSRGPHQPGSGPYSCVHLSLRALPKVSGNRFILFPGCYYEYDDGWLSGNQQFCSFDCIGAEYRYVKAYHDARGWHIRQAGILKYSKNGSSYTMKAIAKCNSYRGDAIPRTTNVVWVKSSWASESSGITRYTVSDPNRPAYDLAAQTDYFRLTPPLGISNLVANAYVDAISRAPANDVNNIGNLIAVYDLLKSLMAGPKQMIARNSKDLFKGLADAWLQYRYVYQTSAMDIHETAEYILRSSEVRGNGSCKCNGIATVTAGKSNFIARCSVTLTPEGYSSLQSEVERFGLALSSYAAWDLVPWSFVVDWFLRIGDRLEYYSKRNRALRLEPGPCWYSLTRNYVDEELGANVSFYCRWQGDKPTTSGCFVDHSPSNTTIVKRAVDVFALTR